MKTAITVSGAQRYHHRGLFDLLLNRFRGLDEVDFFVRVWKHPEFADSAEQLISLWHDFGIPKHWNFRVVQVLPDKPPHHPPYVPLNLAHWAPNFLTMWWGIVRSNDLRVQYQEQTGTEYDLVFRLRTDSYATTPDVSVDINDYVERARTTMFTGINFGDIIQFGSPGMYDRFINYWQYVKHMSLTWQFVHPEESLEEYFKISGIAYDNIPIWITPYRVGTEYDVRPGDW